MRDTQRHDGILRRAAEKYYRGLDLQEKNSPQKVAGKSSVGIIATIIGVVSLANSWNLVGQTGLTVPNTATGIFAGTILGFGLATIHSAYKSAQSRAEGRDLITEGRYHLQVELAIEAQERYHVTGLNPETISLTAGEYTETTVERDGRKLLVKVGLTSLIGTPLTIFKNGEEL